MIAMNEWCTERYDNRMQRPSPITSSETEHCEDRIANQNLTFGHEKIGQKFIFGCLEHEHLLLHDRVLVLVKKSITFILNLGKKMYWHDVAKNLNAV